MMNSDFDWGRTIKGELYERWPKDDTGAPEEPKWLCNCKNLDMGDELKINMLEAYGIPCLKLYPGDGGFGKLILGMSGQGSDIYVPCSLYEEAAALCNSEPEMEE